jgi:hypothetical protein
MTKPIGYACVSKKQQPLTGSRWTYLPTASGATPSTWNTWCPWRKRHDPSSIWHSRRLSAATPW